MSFDSFPKIWYDSKGQGISHISSERVAIRSKIKDNGKLTILMT